MNEIFQLLSFERMRNVQASRTIRGQRPLSRYIPQNTKSP